MILPEFRPTELDDRREIFRLLELLSPQARRVWLEWCCEFASRGHPPVFVTRFGGTANEAYLDAMTIIGQGELTLEVAGGMAVELVKAFEKGEKHGIGHIRSRGLLGNLHPSIGIGTSSGHHPIGLHAVMEKPPTSDCRE
jgi:hypothetical protein